MKNIPVSKLVPGMITAADVYEDNQKLVLPKGVVLTDKTITRLEFYSILSIKVEDEMAEDSALDNEQPLSFSTRVRNSAVFQKFSKKYEEDIKLFSREINQMVRENKKIDVDVLLANTLSLLETENGDYLNVFDMLSNMRGYDDQTYAHSLNVALLSNVLAKWLRFSPEDQKMAAICGLFHDIGKLLIPEEILKKPSSLTKEEYQEIKTHTLKGFHILEDMGMNYTVCQTALMHHERHDGSGYPLGMKGDQIPAFSALIGIADVYDAMTSARIYRGPLCPFHALGMMEDEGLQKYSPKYIITFLENAVNTYLLYSVRLNTGAEGQIVYVNKNKLSRPTIKVGSNYIDLSSRPKLSIAQII